MTVEDFVLDDIVEALEESSDYWNRRELIKQENNKNPVPRRGLALTPVKFGISFTTLHQEYPDHSQSNPGGMNLGRAYHLNWARYWPTSDCGAPKVILRP